MTSVTVGSGLKYIGNIFSGCNSITNLKVAGGVEKIESGIFDNTPWYANLPYGNVYIGSVYYKYKGTVPTNTNITIKKGTKGIADKAFENASGINTLVHYGFIENFIEELGKKYNIKEIAFDRWGAVQMVQNLEGMGFTVVPFGQGFKDMSPPTKELMKLTLEEKMAHSGHPVLRWMMDNIFIRTDPAGNIKPDKEKSTEKIDGAIALIMALDRAIRCGGESGASVYDNRGILFI